MFIDISNNKDNIYKDIIEFCSEDLETIRNLDKDDYPTSADEDLYIIEVSKDEFEEIKSKLEYANDLLLGSYKIFDTINDVFDERVSSCNIYGFRHQILGELIEPCWDMTPVLFNIIEHTFCYYEAHSLYLYVDDSYFVFVTYNEQEKQIQLYKL